MGEQIRVKNAERRSPLRALMARWPLAVAAAVIGVLCGAGYAAAGPTTYTAEARVAVGYGDLSAGAIAGFPLAAEQLASNYARYVNDQTVLGQGASGASVSASPIPESSVIRLEAISVDERTAVKAAAATSESLVKTVNSDDGPGSPAALLQRYTTVARLAAEAEADLSAAEAAFNRVNGINGRDQGQFSRLKNAFIDANAVFQERDLRREGARSQYVNALTSSQAADLIVVTEAQFISSDRAPRLQRYAALGAVLGLVAALALAVGLEQRGSVRTGSRRASDEDVANT